MKIIILIRYPKVEKSKWKRFLIEQLIDEGYEISIIFGESSYWRHFKAAIKYLRTTDTELKKHINEKKIKLYNYFKKKIIVKNVNDLNSKNSERILKKINPDLILLLGSGIIRKNILTIPKKGAIHCHHGKLPFFRGVNTAEWSLLTEKKVYLSTHYVNTGIDTGDIIIRKKLNIFGINSITELRKLCREESVDLILSTIKKLKENNVESIEQVKGDGKQFYFMHPFFKEILEKKLKIKH